MSKKMYAFACVIVTAIAGVIVGAAEYFNWPAAVTETATIVEGAIIGVLGAWTAKDDTNKIGE